MSDLVARLRGERETDHLAIEAAARIEQLEAELRVVLLHVADLRAADPHHGLGRGGMK
jgi:hypothetical protein